MRTPPSSWSVFSSNELCCGIASAALLILFIGLGVEITGTIPGKRGGPDVPVSPEVARMVLACAVALVALLAAIVARRVARTRSLFAEGREVEASVRKLTYYKGGARQKLELEFELNGTRYEGGFVFLRSSRTPDFSEGTRIPVLVDPSNPKRVVPLALYGDPSGERRAA
jgi:hypothetical protein